MLAASLADPDFGFYDCASALRGIVKMLYVKRLAVHLRRYVRWLLLSIFKRVLRSSDGRALIAENVKGLFEPLPAFPPNSLDMPYRELRNSSPSAAQRGRIGRSSPIFITARFRSGSTLLWNLFRQLPATTAYYEPLNEARWFNVSPDEEGTDPTHRHVTNYSLEYQNCEILNRYYREHWTYRDLYMGTSFWDPDLRRYIQLLLDHATGRPVLQFNRVDFRLAWLKNHFPAAKLVHLYRHPREQWVSSLFGQNVPRNLGIRDFARYDRFYLLQWARDLRIRFPFLDESGIEHPYAVFYLIWRLSYAFGRYYSHYSLGYEALLDAPLRELKELFSFLSIPEPNYPPLIALIDKPSKPKWPDYADDDWFRYHENTCDRVLAEFWDVHFRSGSLFLIHGNEAEPFAGPADRAV